MPTTVHDIPFMKPLMVGKYPIHSLAFRYSYETIKYNFLCKTKEKQTFGFRTETDAKLASKNNDWEYIGQA